jgi:hypothetical protein
MDPTPRDQQIAELKPISEIAGTVYELIDAAMDELSHLMQTFDSARSQYEEAVGELHVLLNAISELHPERMQRYLERRADEAAAVKPPEPGGEHDDT